VFQHRYTHMAEPRGVGGDCSRRRVCVGASKVDAYFKAKATKTWEKTTKVTAAACGCQAVMVHATDGEGGIAPQGPPLCSRGGHHRSRRAPGETPEDAPCAFPCLYVVSEVVEMSPGHQPIPAVVPRASQDKHAAVRRGWVYGLESRGYGQAREFHQLVDAEAVGGAHQLGVYLGSLRRGYVRDAAGGHAAVRLTR